MKKQTYIRPAVTICHCATATILAGSPDKNINIDIEGGDYEGEFHSKPHDVDLWAGDEEEEKSSNLYWQI